MMRDAPDHVVRGIRTIDPAAVLLYWGLRPTVINGKTVPHPVWVLGTLEATQGRREAGARMMATQEALGPRGDQESWQIGKLLYQGFATVAFYPVAVPTWAIVDDFQKRDWLYRNAFDEEFERAADVAEGLPQLQARLRYLQDRHEAESASIWRYAMGKRRSFAVN